MFWPFWTIFVSLGNMSKLGKNGTLRGPTKIPKFGESYQFSGIFSSPKLGHFQDFQLKEAVPPLRELGSKVESLELGVLCASISIKERTHRLDPFFIYSIADQSS